MQLYKSRGFSEFFQDTFSFLKLNGKHLFKHFLIINGAFLMILMLLGYFFTKFYSEIIFGGILNNDTSRMETYMNENMGLFIGLLIAFVTVGLVAGIISFAFIPLYLKLYIKFNGANFGTSELIEAYKSNIGGLFIFLICGILLGIPVLLVMGITMMILIITIIGILLLPGVIAACSLFYNMTLMEYFEQKKGIWESFAYAWSLLFSKFWPAIGCVGLFYLMSYIIQNIITIIPYFFGMASIFTTLENGNDSSQEIGSFYMVIMLVVFLLTFLVSTLLGVIIQLNQGIVFYSLKEENENINTKSVIDEIGTGE